MKDLRDLKDWIQHERPFEIDSGSGATRAEDAQGTPTQSHVSPSILVYEDSLENLPVVVPFGSTAVA